MAFNKKEWQREYMKKYRLTDKGKALRKKELITNGSRRRRNKKTIVLFKGGSCMACGYDKNLSAFDFHHLKDKSFAMGSSFASRTIDALFKEAEKCVLLCRNCHAELHNPEYGNWKNDDFGE